MFIYLATINALAFILMLVDKHKARKNLWRIPEKVLFTVALLGGSLGGLAGMHFARHKTKHLLFQIGFPLLFMGQVLLIFYLWKVFQ